MRNHHTVTLTNLGVATEKVQSELIAAGLWYESSRLPETQVILTPTWLAAVGSGVGAFGFVFIDSPGWFARTFMRLEPGNIYIPERVVGTETWSELIFGADRPRLSLYDVLRHEYAHALAFHYPELVIDNPEFEKAFGGHHDLGEPTGRPRSEFVSDYAMTEPSEDFAETFMNYLRHRRKLPARLDRPAIRKKWRFIKTLCDTIADS